MNKKIAALCLAIIASIPVLARSQQVTTNIYTSLNDLTKDQLVLVINCLGADRAMSVDNCVAKVKGLYKPLPVVKVTSPNTISEFREGTNLIITWQATSTKTVDIRLWNSKTGTVDLITGYENIGTYIWKVKATQGYDADYQIGVRSNNENGSSYDTSDNSFKIKASTTPSQLSLIDTGTNVVATNISTAYGSSSARNIQLATFALKSESNTSKVTKVTATVNGTAPSYAYLYNAQNTVVGTAAVQGNTIVFDNIDIQILKNESKNFIIKGDFYSTPTNGAISQTKVTEVQYSNGVNSGIKLTGQIAGTSLHFYKTVANFKSANIATISTQGNGTSTGYSVTFNVDVTATGGTILDVPSGVKVSFKNLSTGVVYPMHTSPYFANAIPSIGDGSTSRLIVTAAIPAYLVPNGLYGAEITSIEWFSATNGSPVIQTWGLGDLKSVNTISNQR